MIRQHHQSALKAILQSRSKGLILSLAAAAFLSGCAMVGPDYVKPSASAPAEWIQEKNPKIKTAETDFGTWWTVFNDAVLNRLVETAFQQNLDLRIAGLRILEARAQLGIAIGEQFPQAQTGRGGLVFNQGSKNAANTLAADLSYADLSLGFDAAWELDIWGKFRRSVESGVGALGATVASYDNILVSLTAEVARTYILLRTTEQRLAIARDNARIQQRSLEIAEARFQGGVVTELDVAQARSLLRSTQATIPRLESELRRLKNALAVLLGILPAEIEQRLGGAGTIPVAPPEVAVGIPAELLRRRPDIRLAERQVAAQSARIGVAKADLYPHFSLFGTIGLRASNGSNTKAGGIGGSSLGDLFSGDSFEFSGGPAFFWDIFNYGRITNRVRVEDARFQQLAVNHENTVLKAAQEVEDAMAAFLRSQEEAEYLMDSVKASRRSVDLSMLQYQEGLTDYQRVLDTLRFLSQQQDQYVATSGSLGINLVAMYKALGGGWEIRIGKDFVSEKTREEMRTRTDWGNMLDPEKRIDAPAEEPPTKLHGPEW